MTPTKLFKLNLQNFRYHILTLIISIVLGFFLSLNYPQKTINNYKIIIAEDINTKYLIDRVYQRHDKQSNIEQYYKYLTNYVVSEFIISEVNEKAELDIDRKGDYSILRTFNLQEQNQILNFENNLRNFLIDAQNTINGEITSSYEMNFGETPGGVKANSKLFFTKKSKKKGSKPFTLYFVTILIGIIILNFVIILDNPPKK
tara:strand:- start:101 stop:706 length:606 start_codon:yes stop_codon:yes gene_type:complete